MAIKPIIVVGHGLAGAILTQTLIDYGLKVRCIEGKIEHSASRIAAGLVNPFVGPKLNIPLKFSECLKHNKVFFGKWEQKFTEKLFKRETLIRIFNSAKQAEKWIEISNSARDSEYSLSYMTNKCLKEIGLEGEFGAGKTKAFRLDIKKFLRLSQDSLESNDCWSDERFDYSEVSGKEIIIFAEGYNVSGNPFFNWLPFAPAQGEILEFMGPESPAMSNGTWFLPSSPTHFLAGSTWKHTDLKSGPTEQGRSKIYQKLNYLSLSQFKETNHFSGIRSGTVDRNPIIGQHPKFKNLFLFNGFGSRGSTTIKYHADLLVDFIINAAPLPYHTNLKRFMKLFTE